MKKYILLLFAAFFSAGCSDSDSSNKNPYLPNYSFSVDINLNLPLYFDLKSPGSGIYYGEAGVKGLIIFNSGGGYNAFDAACPNHDPSNCVAMTIKGVNALCSCDKKEYNLFTGQPDATTPSTYPLKQYRVQVVSETLIRVSN